MREIPLTQGMIALVDDEDYTGLARWKWYYHKGSTAKTGYAKRKHSRQDGEQKTIFMHRIILNTPPKYQTDHINGNGLDNRKENLRVATHSQNKCNAGKYQNNTSGFKGVSWRKDRKRWLAYIRLGTQRIHIGYFKDKLKAASAYNKGATKCHGEFARLNQVNG